MTTISIAATPQHLSRDFDPWREVPYTDLPADLVEACRLRRWMDVRGKLRTLMDGVTTDGQFGRQLLQLVRQLPLGVDPLFDRWRAMIAIDYGDWDDLRAALLCSPVEPRELEGIRDVWLSAVSQRQIPEARNQHQAALFMLHHAGLERDWRAYRQHARRMIGLDFAEIVWERADIPARRHLLYRRLQDASAMAVAEANGGRLHAARGFAREAQQLGGEGEQMRIVARDLDALIGVGIGEPATDLNWPHQLVTNVGFSPLGTWESLTWLLPLMSLAHPQEFEWSARVTARVAAGMASPKA